MVGINRVIVGKCDPDHLSYSGAWSAATLSLAGLAGHIGQGHPWMPALLDEGQRRYQQYANHAEVLALDIDGGMAIAQALGHPVIAAHCGLGIESASSSPELNKYRLVFVLPQAVDGWQTIRICNRYLAHLVGTADPACKDASRYFFGAPGRSPFLLNDAATLPASFVEDALAWHDAIEAQEAARAEQARRAWEEYQRLNPGQDTDALILEALNAISPDCDYNTWLSIGMALAGMGDQWLSVWDGWSAGASSYKPGECDRKWSSFRGKRPAPEVIFGTAKKYGWRFPRRSWLEQISNRLTRKPSPQKSAQALKSALGDKPFSGHEYEPGQRLATWQEATKAGYRYVLDASGTGEGKSHDAGSARPEMFGDDVAQLFYLSNSHYSPTTDTLKDWADLHGRHKGLTRESLPDGSTRLRRAKRGEERVVPANCGRTDLINVLRSKNISGADDAGLICNTCPLQDACRHSQGSGFGFLNQRKLALAAPLLRLHPDSAPGDDYAWGKAIAIWDEPSESFTVAKGIVITATDVDQVIARLAVNAPEIFDRLRLFLAALRAVFEARQGKYGIGHRELLAALPALPEGIDATELRAALAPDLSLLDPEVAEGVRVSDLPGSNVKLNGGIRFQAEAKVNLRRHFNEAGDEAQQQAEATVIKQWLPELIGIASGGAGGLHLSYESLTITQPSDRHREIAAAAKGNILLDATLTVEDAALLLGCEAKEIYLCRQRPQAGGNLQITQITDLGKVGMQRGADQKRRVEALVSHYKGSDPTAKAIDFKKFGGDGAWWRDSRGSNAFQGCNTLLLIGTPCPNLAALQAKYACMVGGYPQKDAEAFTAWCDRLIRADIHQGIGRLRANRRPTERLHVVVVNNFDLGLPCQQVAAKDITIQAASKSERAVLTVRAAIEQLKAKGAKVTARAIEALCDYKKSRIAELLKLSGLAIEDSNSETGQDSGDPPPELAALVWGAIDLCSTEAEIGATVADLLSGIVAPANLLAVLLAPPPKPATA